VEPVFRLVARGEAIRPETMSIAELVDILGKVDRAVKSLIAQNRALDERVELSLVGIESSSSVLTFATNRPPLVEQAVDTLNMRLATQSIELLPGPAQDLVTALQGWTRRKSASVAIVPEPKGYDDVPWISVGSVITQPVSPIRGETVLEGILLRVGGKIPKIGLVIDGSRLLPCSASADLARQAAPLLYQHVVLEGEATWDASNWLLVGFTAQAILEHSPGPTEEALAELARLAGPGAWSDWDDVQSVIAELRKE